MLKDEFTEKYYEEDNPHNKDLFNPDKAVVRSSPKTTIKPAQYLNQSLPSFIKKEKQTFFMPKEDSI